MISIILWDNMMLKQIQCIHLVKAHFPRGIAVRIVFGVLAEISQVSIIHWHTELRSNFRERCHRFHWLDAVGDADVAFTVNEINLVDHNF